MPSTIGKQLQSARLDRNLSLEDVAESTHIRIKYIEALEADDFSVMPSPVQGRGFLRLYAQYLDLDIDAPLEELRSGSGPEIQFEKVEDDKIFLDVDSGETLNLDESESKTLWERFQHRVSESLASPKPVPVHEVESVPIAEANLKYVSELFVDAGEQTQPTEESQIIFAKVGKILQERREMLSLSFAEIEGHLHLRPHYLAALEAGDFETLPSPVQTRGMLSNYAGFLDLDTDPLLILFAEGLQAQRIERHLEEHEHLEGSQKKRRRFILGSFVAPDLIFGLGMALLLVLFAIWGMGRIANISTDTQVDVTAPSIAEILMTTPTAIIENTPTPTVLVNTPAPDVGGGPEIPIEEILPEGGVQILVTMMERAWLRVIVDGEVVFEGRSQPNATFIYEGNETIEIFTANGAGVRIAYNQRDLGLLGGFGEVVQRLYGARGILTPTVTPTSEVTATFTPTMTSTSTPSKTPTPLSVGANE